MKELPTLGHFATFDSIIIYLYTLYFYHLSQHIIFSMGFAHTLVRRDQYSGVLTDGSRIIFIDRWYLLMLR